VALDDRNQRLLGRADRALGRNSPVEAVRKVRAIIGPTNIPDSEQAAQAALEILRRGEIPTAEQITALEVVVRLLRPVVFTRHGLLEDLPETENKDLQPTELKDLWSTFKDKVKPFIGSVGRVENSQKQHVGTGFVVADRLIATNRHVLAALTMGSEVLPSGRARIVFKQEVDDSDASTDIAQISGVAKIHPVLDIVLMRTDTAGRQPVRFAGTIPTDGDQIATLGYPAKDEGNNPLFLAPVFSGKFGVRRAALGEIRDGTMAPNIFHDCSTTQGNSGSPVFLLSTGQVAGIHRSGYFMYRNEALVSDEIRSLI
jgi:S1-C subfamily serine protease